jgi:hypothetical protein
MDKGIRSIIIGLIIVVVLFFIGRYVWREVQKAMIAKTAQESATGMMNQENGMMPGQ